MNYDWWPVDVLLPDNQVVRARMIGWEWVPRSGWCCRTMVSVWDWAPPQAVWVPMLAPSSAVRRVPGVDYRAAPAVDQYVLAGAGGQLVLHYQRCTAARGPDDVVVSDSAARSALEGGRTTACPRCRPVVGPDTVMTSVERAAARGRA